MSERFHSGVVTRSQGAMKEEYGKGTPLFTPVVAPRLAGITRYDCIQFRLARETYLDICAERGAEVIKPWSIKHSFDPTLLTAVCKYDLKKDEKLVTDADLDAFIQKRLNDTSICVDVETLMKRELKMNLEDKDVNSRVLALFTQMDRIAEMNALQPIFKLNQKLKVKCLVAAIRPMNLKMVVENEIKYKYPECKKDIAKCYDLVLRLAIEQQRFQYVPRVLKDSDSSSTDTS